MGGLADLAMELEQVALQAAIEAGAIEVCEFHDYVTVTTGDDEAEKLAYAIATNKWKSGEVGGEREDLMDAVQQVIGEAAWECPACQKHMTD